MQRIGHWAAGALFACVMATGVAACGGSSSDGDGDSSDGDSDGTSGGSGGSSSGSGDNGTSSGDDNTSSGNGSGTTGLAMGPPVEVEAYAEEAASIVCEWLAPCCGDLGLAVTQGGCTTALEAGFAADYASADPNNYTFDADLAGDCLATARELYQDFSCDLETEPGDVASAADEICDLVFQGKLAPGTPCTAEIECAREPGDNVECDTLDSDATVCIVERRAAAGDPCYWTCTDEGGAYFCSGAGGDEPALQGRCYTNDQLYCESGVCARQPALGEACAANATCAEGYCLNGICSPAGDSGDACVSDSECGEGLYCESTACAPKKANGEACEFYSQCQSESCGDDGLCADVSEGGLGIALLCAVASGQL